eukprot:6869466-Karenia_brevis.AAC.1
MNIIRDPSHGLLRARTRGRAHTRGHAWAHTRAHRRTRARTSGRARARAARTDQPLLRSTVATMLSDALLGYAMIVVDLY